MFRETLLNFPFELSYSGLHSPEQSNSTYFYTFNFYFFVCRDDEETTNRHRPHVLRTSEYCWCDREAMDAFNEVSELTCNLKLEASKVCFTLN